MPPLIRDVITIMETFLIILFAIILVIFLTLIMTFHKNSGLKEIDKWATKEGLEILSSEYRWLKRGPYFINSSNQQRIFYVTVRDKAGNIKKCWVKVGGFFFGLLSDKIDISWEN